MAGRIRVIPYAVRPGLPRLDAPVVPVLLYAGRVHPEKGVHVLVSSFARLASDFPEVKLRIIGPVREDQGGAGDAYLSHLKTLAGNAEERIEWLPPLFDYALLREEYQRASLLVYPSLAETGESFGLAPLEAMSCGCPALVSSLECFADYLEPGKNGWTFNHRVEDPSLPLEAALRSCLQHPEALQAARVRAVETAQRFTVEQVADRMLEDFAELLES
jgi:glycosyltransferase involved in cell wall biosynthesis